MTGLEGDLLDDETCFAIARADRAGILVDGDDYYREAYRALRSAQHYIALTAWQLDSQVRLLRGADAEGAGEVRLLPLLRQLLAERESLHAYVLSWDFHPLFLFERELLHRFRWSGIDRLTFELDGVHPTGASHHQKLLIVDGRVAFLGGMDVCASRWDRRIHRPGDSDRTSPRGRVYGPYHDVQAFVTGPAVEPLVQLFERRFEAVTGQTLVLPRPAADGPAPVPSIPLEPHDVGLSETREGRHEILALFERALGVAERLIYIENQYYSADAIHAALLRRMTERSGNALEIVFVLPKHPEALKEEIAIGVKQARLLDELTRTAAIHGHRFGVYYPTGFDDDGEEVTTYVHSKVIVVDDRILAIGSANTTNRSMGLDTELNVTWCYDEPAPAVRDARASLLAEHARAPADTLGVIDGLVDVLDALAARDGAGIRPHPRTSLHDETPFVPADVEFDPDVPIDQLLWESLSADLNGPFAEGIDALRELLHSAVGRDD